MKLTVDRNALLKALSHAQSVVEKRTTLPILSHILIQASAEDGLTISATDLEISIIEKVSAQVEKSGQITASAHLLYDIVRKLHEGATISLHQQEKSGYLVVTSDHSEFKLPTLASEEFPLISRTNLPISFALPVKDLRRLIERTRFAMSTEETRYFLNGIFLHVVDGTELRAVATDGHRLARVSLPAPEAAKAMPGIIVSRKTVNELCRLMADTTEDVTLSISDTQISFSFPNAYLVARLIDGQYPDYNGAIPANNTNILHLKVKSFSQAVDRVATVSSDRLSGIRVNLNAGKLLLTASNGDASSAQEEIDVNYEGEGINIGFNSRYLLDIAQHIEDEEAQVALADNTSPVIIRSTSNNNTLYVLMPMRF